MSRSIFRYVAADPPAPFALTRLAKPDHIEGPVIDLPAKVDSGADRTIIPVQLVERLNLSEADRLTFAGLGGLPVVLPVYRVLLTVRDFPPLAIEVAASDGEPHILLGRDVLNRYRVLLDGPNRRTEFFDD